MSRLRVAAVVGLLGGLWACATAVDAGPRAASSASGGAASDDDDIDLAALRARPAAVIDARTRPEPHPTIPVGTRLTAYIGPRFLTGEDFMPEARVVVADEHGRVRALLRALPEPNPYPTVTLPGALAVAGLHDAHLHLEGLGMAQEDLDASAARSPAALRAAVVAFVAAHPDVAVVRGRGWDQSRYPGQAFPTWRDLEGATTKPIWLRRVDGHAGLANKALLDKAGITKATADPPGGRILRDAGGEPTGVLVDNAMDLVTPHLPAATDADRARWLRAGLRACADAGLVAVHDMGMSVASFRVLQGLAARAPLPVRTFVYLDGSDDAAYDVLGTVAATDTLALLGVKLFADGALGSRGAALLDDYSDEPGHRGLVLLDRATLERRVRQAHDKGFQVAVHAIGDAANRVVIDVLTAEHRDDIRDRLEHAQILALDDIPRLHPARITASMQPTHATSDMRWAEARVGAERLAGAYAWRRILDTGAALAFGSDAPVEDVRPAWGIYAALTRQDHAGEPQAGFTPDQRLDLAQTLRAFSRHAAWAVNLERHAGALTPGMFFDVSLFDLDAAAATDAGDPAAWLRARPVGTVVGGVLRTIP
jgi:predicted amidohydrolase YtcJ